MEWKDQEDWVSFCGMVWRGIEWNRNLMPVDKEEAASINQAIHCKPWFVQF